MAENRPAGIFTRGVTSGSVGDLKPYPASAYSSLPEPYRIEVPLGLWQPVQLEYMGPIAVDWVRLKPTFEGADGRLEVEARLRNLDGRQMEGQVELAIPTHARESIRLRRDVRLAGGAEETVTMRLAFPGAKRWQPWRFGESTLYRAEITAYADGAESSRVDDVFAFRELTWDIGPRRWSLAVNGRPMFLRGACYAPGTASGPTTWPWTSRGRRRRSWWRGRWYRSPP